MLLFGYLWVFLGRYCFRVCFVNIVYVYLRFRGLGIIMQSFDVTPAFVSAVAHLSPLLSSTA